MGTIAIIIFASPVIWAVWEIFRQHRISRQIAADVASGLSRRQLDARR